MKTTDLQYFNLLKKAVAETFLAQNNASDQISNWKGDEIVLFQEDLFLKVKAKVSEKWFYTYFKNQPEKLPRIDMLNLLSQYVGKKNWNDFIAAHPEIKSDESGNKRFKYWWLVILPVLLLAYFLTKENKNRFQFCFVDEEKSEAITNITLDIKVLLEGETPQYYKTDSLGCFNYETVSENIMFVVQSPYHKTDTIVRNYRSMEADEVKLATDDYALMLDYYSNGKVTDWQKRRTELGKLFDDNAIIYQMYSNSIGVEIYSKEEFINKLTTPTSTLKRMKILDRTYKDDKIVKLKFIIQ